MSHFFRLVLVATLLLSSFPVSLLLPGRSAYALGPEGVAEVVTALQSLGTVVNSLSDLAGLGEPIPFTDVDPSEALNLDSLFSDALGDLGAPSSLAGLATVIDGKDNPDLGGTGISVQFDAVGNDTDNTLTFVFTATHTMNAPLKFASGDVNLDGTGISEPAVTFSLAAPFAFGYDGGASNPSEKVFLTNEPTIAVTASANVPTVTAFESLLGFTSVSVGGSLALNVAINSTFVDPDSNGRLTMDEWASTALGDLVTVAFADGPGDDVNGNLTLDASIIPGSPDASVVWVDASIADADGHGTPTVTLNALDDFTNINATDIFGGLASATTALLAAQQSGDLQLPFLKESLSDLFKFADPLVKFVHELGDAAVVCGTDNSTMPPRGSTFGLDEGDPVYCQAFTISPVDEVKWKVGTDIKNEELTTVGPNPSSMVELLLGPGGLDSITVEFHIQGEVDKDDKKIIRQSRPLFLTADELTAKLLSIAGIDIVEANYDATKNILTYHLHEPLPGVSKVVETDFADQLKEKTGMFGLNPAGAPKITVEVSNIHLDVTFGVILVPDPAAIKAGGTDSDRFFLQVGDGNEFQADVAIAAGSDFRLEGRLAFLKVTAGGATTAGNPGGAIFALNDSDDAPGAPALAVNITAPGVTLVSLPETIPPETIPNAILVSDLLSGNIGPKITAQCELGLSAGLEAKATNVMKSGGSELASGKVAISWPDVFGDGTCVPEPNGADGNKLSIDPDLDFNSDLFSFDINTENPLEMLSIILNSVSGLAGAIDTLPGVGDQAALEAQIPVIGVSPRELLDKLEEISAVMNEAAQNPADTLDDLEQWLEEGPNGLKIDPDALRFELGDVGLATEKDLILRLGYAKTYTLTRPLNFDLNDGGLGLVSASGGGNIMLEYTAGAQFDVAIPLKLGSALTDTLVLDTTKATVGGSLNGAENLNFQAAVGPLEVGVTGLAKVNVNVEAKNPNSTPLSFDEWLDGVDVNLTGAVDCGALDVNPDPNIADNKALTGQACAKLGLNVGGDIGTLGFRAEDITSDPVDLGTYTDGTRKDWFVYIPSDLTTKIAENVLNWSYLFKVLPELSAKLEGMLRDGAEDVSVPGLGETLDAGADVVGVINREVISPTLSIASVITGTTALEVENQIRAEVKTITVLQPFAGPGAVDNVAVVTYCGGPECADDDSVSRIDDVRVTFKIGQEIKAEPDFKIGIAGLPIQASGAMKATGSWSLLIDVGLNKTEGPYIVANAPDPELYLSANVGLADNPHGCKANPDDGKSFPQPAQYPESIFPDFSPTRCLQGQLAFLAVGLHDGDKTNDNVVDQYGKLDDKGNDPTTIALTTTLDLTSDATSGRLTAGNIINSVGLHPRFVASANIDLAMRTSIEQEGVLPDGLPGVVGAFHLEWGFDSVSKDLGAPEVTFDNLYIDAGTFVSDLLGPVVTQVRKVTSPLEPIVDFIQSEVPVLTQLSEMVGGEKYTVLRLIKESAGFSDEEIALFYSVLQFIQLANKLPDLDQAGAGNLFIELGNSNNPGWFTLDGGRLLQGATTPDQAESLITASDAGTDFDTQLPGNSGGGMAALAADDRPTTFGVKGLSFPFLKKGSEIFGLLLGKDVTIVHMDFGTFSASVSEGYEFGPIFIGPFPVTAEVGLSFTAEARFAMGYDTRGLRDEVLGGANVVKLFKGLYIDDYNAEGLDVDEWRLTFRVYAEAALDFVIVEAGIYGGVDAILSGNLHDPNPDGKLYFDEAWQQLSNPICLFDISGKLDLFLGIYLEIDLFFWSDRWELEIVRMTLLDFTVGCKGTDPNLAFVDDNGNLVLNMGSRAGDRGIQKEEPDEEFTVRQVGDGRFSVEAFGLKEDVPDTDEIADGKAINMADGKVLADAGDGNDTIALVAGGVTTVPEGNPGGGVTTPVTFTLASELHGGPGNDALTGADGDDILNGGGDADKLIGGKGNDRLFGEDGEDRIDGGIGVDTIDAGSGNDMVNGGPGGDTISGGDGNDSLLGGPWSPGTPEKPRPYLEGLDGVDTITGGIGNDIIDGGPDNDILYGDEKLVDDEAGPACFKDGDSSGGSDNIQGGPGNDTLFGGYGADHLTGNGGHVIELWPYSDNDMLCGNAGADTLDGDDEDPAYDLADYNDGTFAGGLWGGSGNDTLYGRGGADQMHGGADDDYMEGNGDVDTMYGDAGQDDMIGGSAAAGGADEGDVMHGGDNQDVMAGDNATITRPAVPAEIDGTVVRTVTLRDPASSEADTAEAGADEMYGDGGNDDMYGGAENDTMYGNAGQDFMRGGSGVDTMQGNVDNDEMYGDSGDDDMFGNENDDTMRGNTGDDNMEGNDGVDTMYGDAGQDDMIGGSGAAGQPDGGDIMFGNAGLDVMAGDNALIVGGVVTLYDLAAGNDDTLVAGEDTMQGDEANDRMHGGGEHDVMHGNAGDDYMEGNGGSDTMNGDADQDDLIGGTSQAGQPDDGDTMYGDASQDIMAGDNAAILRPGGTEIDGTFVRQVTLYDLFTGNDDTPVAGADTMEGNDGNDDLYGGGEHDVMNGNAGDDMIEGNGATDTLYGDAGQDDLIGGTSHGGGGQPDAADTIYGGSNGPDLPGDFDVIAGDNASIVRAQNEGVYVTDDFADDALGVVRRIVTLFDIATITTPSPANTSGGDTLLGEGSFDILYGQGSDEVGISGGTGNDEMYGNDGDDLMLGNDGQDDMIGGTGRVKSDDLASAVDGRLDGSDNIFGGNQTKTGADADDFDVILGDNATAFRTRDLTTGFWVINSFNAAISRVIRFYDVGTVTDTPGAGTSAGDFLYGEDADDLVYGQGGDDTMQGNGGGDYMEGNAATDTMHGNDGNDDMVGGTGRINDDPANGTNGRLDANDLMYGNDGFDVMAGDNALLARTLINGQWANNTFNAGIQHEERILQDENSPVALLVSGGDLMRGGAHDDLMYGQAGNDDMDGNAGDDFMEGNSDDDEMWGSADQDDMIGGTVDGTIWDGADTMYGGSAGDVMSGDNATIQRPLAGGLWQIEPNTLDEVRTITLLNVQVVGGPAADPLLSGSDILYGNEGSDRMFGQTNDDSDDDDDGLFNEDPADGVDNDMDGSESGASTQYDCADGFDNDGDGQTDAADPQCSAKIDEDAGGDVMYGNEGDDFMEGNHGADLMYGNENEDDMWGGSSSDATGVVGSSTPPDNLADTNDIVRGGEEDDVLVGDNGTIVRLTDGGGIWLRHQGARANGDGTPFDMVVRSVGVTQSPEAAGAFGNDWMQGNDGEDEGYGQQGDDYMEGNNGEDALLGDLGLITSSIQDGSNQQTIAPPGPFFSETIYPAGSFYRQFRLFSFSRVPAAAGNDIILGGDDRDSLHGADGNDIINGDGDATTLDSFTGVDPNPLTLDVDKVFGGDGADVMWGGRGDDNMWGGWGDDYLDVRPRSGVAAYPNDPPLWHTFGRFDFYQGLDLIYGGWDQDAMQANVAAPGPRITDRLIDWVGGYNAYYVCPGAYGEGTITREQNPFLRTWMQRVIDADGAYNSATASTSGFREYAFVFPKESRLNSHPIHPDHPAHFVCN